MAFRPTPRKMLSYLLLAACLATVVIVLPDRLILFPSREPLASIGATRSTVPFRGGELEIWTARTRPKAPPDSRADLYVLRFYGNADRADPSVGTEIGDWAARDTVVWGVNYPGYGGSSGDAHLGAIGPAALAAYDALRAKAGADRPVIVFGTSLGTTAALHVAAERPDLAGLILQNPPPIRQMILRGYGWWNLWIVAGPMAWRVPSALDSVANAHRVRIRGVFLLAENDEIVAPKYQRLVVEAYAGEKRVVPLPGQSHNSGFDAQMGEFHAAVDWLLGPSKTR